MKSSIFLICLFFMTLGLVQSQIICIDPGHGGSDPGATGWGLEEANINLDVSTRLYSVLKNAGYKPYLTRSGDDTVSLSSRTSYANNLGANRFISVHCNAFNQSAYGTETYCYTEGSTTSFNMRNAVNPRVVDALGTYNRGCKTANYYVVKYTNMPAILCELAFIDNQSDSAKLGNATYRQKAAEAIKAGLQASYDRAEEESMTGTSYVAPRWSPDGSSLLVSHVGYNGMLVLPVSGGKALVLSNESRVGYKARWISKHEIACTKGAENETFVVKMDGTTTPLGAEAENLIVIAEEGEIWVEEAEVRRQLIHGEDTFFHPVLSPDKTLVVYEGLRTGLHVCDLNGESAIALGAGNNPVWTPDSKKIVFDHAKDNGSMIVESDIWVVSLEKPGHRVNLTQSGSLLAQRPSISPNGLQIAFDAQGSIFVGNLENKQIKRLTKIEIVK